MVLFSVKFEPTGGAARRDEGRSDTSIREYVERSRCAIIDDQREIELTILRMFTKLTNQSWAKIFPYGPAKPPTDELSFTTDVLNQGSKAHLTTKYQKTN